MVTKGECFCFVKPLTLLLETPVLFLGYVARIECHSEIERDKNVFVL